MCGCVPAPFKSLTIVALNCQGDVRYSCDLMTGRLAAVATYLQKPARLKLAIAMHDIAMHLDLGLEFEFSIRSQSRSDSIDEHDHGLMMAIWPLVPSTAYICIAMAQA